MGIKETISKVLGKDTSSAEKLRMLFGEQGIMITSILMAIGMAIGVLIKTLLSIGGSVAAQDKGGSDSKPENAKEWLRNKLNPS